MTDTKTKLANALKTLMQTEAIDKITVNELAKFAHVSRNTFYYHFLDIHDLLAWIYNHEVIAQLDDYQNQDHWLDGLKLVLEYIEQNKKFCLNTFRSLDRDLLNCFLYKNLYKMVVRVVDEIDDQCPQKVRNEIGNFYGSAIEVQLVQWLITNLEESKSSLLDRMYAMLHTTLEYVVKCNANLYK
ncbi:TetR family transcriptional regulator [Companilactobacillus sp. RD055328]|uniref:TetR/AcrR family transcriptional regulator C-terminal domain-containing protein n=1 Tax=Companilactobacillus sp. RD055328 TaxID=2916634 RepID=UPI001FC8C77E|nr:TetR/AcrR family transcriptional regulator C-terminal domain-containing protein [Companilactobacillus sp. RD055328]GKQ42269.1 TetR family transcriptional regulator [Companilactobacillus sp. RD055328]